MKHLYYFMADGIGINVWNKVGTLHRELAIFETLINKGWKVTLISYDRDKRITVDTKVHILPEWLFGYLRGPLRDSYYWLMPIFNYPVKNKKNIVIMTNQAALGWPALIAKRIWKVPFVARSGYILGEQAAKLSELTEFDQLCIPREKQIFSEADLSIVPTEVLKDWVAENYQIPASALNIIPNYVDTRIFFPLPDIQRQRSVLIIARLHEDKRIPLVIEALKGTGVALDIVGEGSIRNELMACAATFGVQLNLLGRVENKNLPTLMAAAGCFVISGVTEGHPKALIEAMAAAMPCIGVHGQGIDNVLTEAENGLLVDADPEQLRQAILTMLDNTDLAARLGESARDFSVANYSLETVAEKYDRLLSSLLD
jgi:glycosyltransferase involved in cell wall biosynthesis